jgi:hypothetical protein
MTPPGSWATVVGIAAIGLLILLIACFNFMNLAIARAMLRAREIAVRKCVGASRGHLVVQFLGESGAHGAFGNGAGSRNRRDSAACLRRLPRTADRFPLLWRLGRCRWRFSGSR